MLYNFYLSIRTFFTLIKVKKILVSDKTFLELSVLDKIVLNL